MVIYEPSRDWSKDTRFVEYMAGFRWEYLAYFIPAAGEATETLTELEVNRWELVSITGRHPGGLMWFKRERART